MKKTVFGTLVLLVSVMAHGGGEALYKQGTAVYQSDPEQAFGLFVQAAEAGHPAAMAGAGYCLEKGTGTPVDYAKAIEWYEKAIAHNSLKACEGLARIHASCPDPEFHDGEKAVKYASVTARKKPRDAEALALLASAYARNIDFDRAIKTQTAAQRSAPIGESKEYKRQVERYIEGEPLPAKATEGWVLRAANSGAVWAVIRLAHWASTPDGAQYQHLALKLCQKTIDKGRADLLIQMGNIYLEKGDLGMAHASYQEAYSRQCYSIETARRSFLKKSPEAVFEWGKKFGDGYETEVTVGTGVYLYDSNGDRKYHPPHVEMKKVPPCRASALFLLKIAEKKGHPEAAEALEYYR